MGTEGGRCQTAVGGGPYPSPLGPYVALHCPKREGMRDPREGPSPAGGTTQEVRCWAEAASDEDSAASEVIAAAESRPHNPQTTHPNHNPWYPSYP